MTDPLFEGLRRKPVLDAVTEQGTVLARMVNVGMLYEWGGFPPTALASPVTFRRAGRAGLMLTHVQPVAFGVCGDRPRGDRGSFAGLPVVVNPMLSMRLQNGGDAQSGIVASLEYAELDIPESEFEGDGPLIDDRLVPGVFRVWKGSHAEGRPYGGAEPIGIGGEGDRGDIARFMAQAIHLTATAFAGYSQEEMFAISGCSVG